MITSDIWKEITTFLDFKDLLLLSQVSKYFYLITNFDNLWNFIFFKSFNENIICFKLYYHNKTYKQLFRIKFFERKQQKSNFEKMR